VFAHFLAAEHLLEGLAFEHDVFPLIAKRGIFSDSEQRVLEDAPNRLRGAGRERYGGADLKGSRY
jgi:hypothetical protein